MTNAKFTWYDLNSKDAPAAEKFYAALFGWNVMPWKPTGAPPEAPEYRMIAIGEAAFGGINAIPAETPAPSHWMGHILVDDVDAPKTRAEGMKAQFPMGVMEIPTVGRMAMMMDPQGCAVSLFSPAVDAPVLPTADQHGMVGWNELIAADPKAAKAFYSEVVGWKWREGPMAAEMEYHLFGTGEEGGDAGGMMPKGEQMPVSAWVLYFTTHDIAKTVARVTELGGKVHAPVFEVPTVGKLAICEGADGSMFGLAQWAPRPA